MQTKPNLNKRSKSEEQKNKIKRNYQELDNEHNNMKESVKKYIEEESDNKKQQENTIKGGYNKIQINKGVNFVIRKPKGGNKKYESSLYFSTLFAQSLLKICGESTITIGKYDDKKNNNFMYMDKADGNLIDYRNSSDYLDRSFVKNFIDYFNTNYFSYNPFIKDLKDSYEKDLDNLLYYWKDSYVAPIFQTIARHLCKIFLFQMYDRKPQNILYFDIKDKKKQKFIDIDFDDGDVTCLFSLPTFKDKEKKSECNNARLEQMRNLVSKYENFIKKINGKDKLKFWKDIFSKQINNYTITEDKMIRLIREVAKKSKYFGLSKKEIVEGINGKIKAFQTMLEDKGNEELFKKKKNDKEDYMELIRRSRSETNKTLEQFIKFPNRIEEIVTKELDGQDFYLLSQHAKHSRNDMNKETEQFNNQKSLQKFRKKFESNVELENKSVNNISSNVRFNEEQTADCSCCVIY